MKRAVVFVLLVVAFLVFTFPHELVVRRLAARRLPADVAFTFGTVRPSFVPLGYRLADVVVDSDTIRVDLDSVRVGVGLFGGIGFDVDACGGRISGEIRRSSLDEERSARDLDLRLDAVDPSSCVEIDGPELAGAFTGQASLAGLGRGDGAGVLGRIARQGTFSVAARSGSVSGYLPNSRRTKPSGKKTERQPIGRWEFASISVEGSIQPDRIVVSSGRAEAEGVAWESLDAAILTAGSSPRVQIELRARRIDDSARSKAIMGLLPKAVEREGWRRYRISGTPSNVQITGLK